MKKVLLFLTVIISLHSNAQEKPAEEVLAAEKSFAAYSVAHGTKAAFLKFLDSNGLVFENGKAINGIEAWNKKEVRPGVLNWHPVYGAIAASADLGFTTGPWTFQPKTASDSVVARGQYSTLWKKDKKGEWKFIIDMGISKTPAFDDASFVFRDEKINFVPGTWNNLLNKEQQFIQRTKDADSLERVKWYKLAASKSVYFLNRNGRLPATSNTDRIEMMPDMPKKIDYAIDGSGISKAGDLGYVYGTTVINGKTDNYLRIWKREGKEWKLALEVLQY